MLPYIWRLFQCLRQYRDIKQRLQLANGAKYVASFTPLIFVALAIGIGNNLYAPWSPFRTTWVVLFFIAMCYGQYWDMRYDWGLLRKNKKHWLLRERLLLKFPIVCFITIMIRSDLLYYNPSELYSSFGWCTCNRSDFY